MGARARTATHGESAIALKGAAAAAESPKSSNGIVAPASPVVEPMDAFDPHGLRSWSRPALFGCLLLLVSSGTLKTLTTQLASNQAATHTSSLLLVWLNYAGQYLFAIVSNWLNRKNQAERIRGDAVAATAASARTRSLLIGVAILDVVGCIFCLVATIIVGSGLYQVLYASILVMTALLSGAVLGFRQNARQWLCLVIVTVGLWACTLASQQPTTPSVGADSPDDECSVFFPSSVCAVVSLHTIGVTLTLVGTFIYACQSVCCELLHTSSSFARVTAGELNGAIGWYGLLLSSAYVLVYTLPRWTELVEAPMAAHSLSWADVAWTLGLYLLANVLHRITYWSVVERTGSIFAGLANALRTVAVFALSAYLFCDDNASQCATPAKTAAATIVVASVVFYQLAHSSTKEKAKNA